MTGPHQLDSPPDLPCKDSTAHDVVDGWEPTHNPLAATDGLPACLVVRIVGSCVGVGVAKRPA